MKINAHTLTKQHGPRDGTCYSYLRFNISTPAVAIGCFSCSTKSWNNGSPEGTISTGAEFPLRWHSRHANFLACVRKQNGAFVNPNQQVKPQPCKMRHIRCMALQLYFWWALMRDKLPFCKDAIHKHTLQNAAFTAVSAQLSFTEEHQTLPLRLI